MALPPATATATATATASDMELVMMSRAELDELHRLRKFMEDLPEYLENVRKQACIEYAAAKLKDLHSREKEDPVKHRERSKKLYDRKREEICAKKRAKNALKRAEQERQERGESSEGE